MSVSTSNFCRSQLIFEAKRILGTDGRVGTDNNDLNAIKTLGSIPKVITNHFLTDTDAWFIRTNVPHGMKYFERRGDQFGQAVLVHDVELGY